MGTTLNEGDAAVPYWDPVKGVSPDASQAVTEGVFECNMALEARYVSPFIHASPMRFDN